MDWNKRFEVHSHTMYSNLRRKFWSNISKESMYIFNI